MKPIIAAFAITLSLAACNSPGERALGGGAIGGLAGAAIGGLATGHTSGALAGAAVGAAGGAVVGAATTPEPMVVAEQAPAMSGPGAAPQMGSGPVRTGVNPGSQGRYGVNPGSQGRYGVNPGSQGRVNQGSQGWTPKDCKYGTMVHLGSVVCSP